MQITPKIECKKCRGSGVITKTSKSKLKDRDIKIARTCSCVLLQILKRELIDIVKKAKKYKEPDEQSKKNIKDGVAQLISAFRKKGLSPYDRHWWIDTGSNYNNYLVVLEFLKEIVSNSDQSGQIPQFTIVPAISLVDHWWAKGDPANRDERQDLLDSDILIFEFTTKAENRKENIAFAEAIERYISYGKRVWLLYSSEYSKFTSTAWSCREIQEVLGKSDFKAIFGKWDA